jgi:hypothetical protein
MAKKDYCFKKDLKASQIYLKLNRKRDDSRKDAKHAKFGETGKYFVFALLAALRRSSGQAWREKIS